MLILTELCGKLHLHGCIKSSRAMSEDVDGALDPKGATVAAMRWTHSEVRHKTH